MIAPALKNEIQGVGLGLRPAHYQTILREQPNIPWLEALSDNYLNSAGLPLHYLEQIRDNYPLVLHGVGMSLGSTDPLNIEYLTRLKKLAQAIESTYISDHLAWVSANGIYLNELMPLPYTEEALSLVAHRIEQVQEFLGQRILIENPSAYLRFTHSTLAEADFLSHLLEIADTYLLLDVNNLYINSVNFDFDPLGYLAQISATRVKQIHLAGYEEHPNYLFDTHGYPVHPPVWDLYQSVLERFGPIPTLIEWDTDIPGFEVLLAEADKAAQLMSQVTS